MADEDSAVTCIADVKAVLGEGPVWVERDQALYWVDIKGYRIFRSDEAGAVISWETPLRVGSLAPRQSGGFVAGTESGLAFADPAQGKFDIFAQPEPERTTNRFNDGKLDRAGRFWAGTIDDEEKRATGALYRVDAGLGCTRMDDDYKVTNGPAFSPDGRVMYHNDSGRQLTYAFDVDGEGRLSERRVLLRFGEGDGYPDGMTVDADGHLWIAFWDGWCLRRFNPAGECVATLKMPVQRPTACTFGGPGLDRLFISSARIGLDYEALAKQPLAGGLFVTEPGVSGLADTEFAG